MSRTLALVGVTALLVLGSVATPAAACACGGPAPIPGTEVNVDRETAIVRWDGDLEEIVMQLDMRSDAGETGLIVPTPSPATVTAGDPAVFTALLEQTEPVELIEWDWWGSLGFGAGSDGTAGGAPPEVLARVQLGPIEATTLAASDAQGLADWLDSNGYALSEAITAELGPYVDEGWSFVALKLTGELPFDGALDPIRFTFATDSLVYPMRMSRAADTPQTVRLYVLGDHRADVTGGPSGTGTTVSWAGPVDTLALAELGTFLTVVDVYYEDPASEVTADLAITDSASDDTVIPTYTTTHLVTVAGIPAGPLIVFGVVVLLIVGIVVAVRLRSRATR